MYSHVPYQGSSAFHTHVVLLHPSGGFRDSAGAVPSVESFRLHLLATTHVHIRGDVSNFTANNYLQDGITALDDDCSDIRSIRLLLPQAHYSAAHVGAPSNYLLTRPNSLSPLVEFSLRLEQPLQGVTYQPMAVDGEPLEWDLATCADLESQVPPGVS